MKSRERVKNECENGQSVKEKIGAAKRVTAGILFKISSCRIRKDVFDVQQENVQKKLAIESAKLDKQQRNFLLLTEKTAAVLALEKYLKNG